MQKGIGRDVGADILERNPRLPVASDPQIDSRNLMTALDHGIGKVELPIKFECPRMDSQCAGGRSRLRCFVYDARLNPEFAQPERKHQTGRTRPDYQNIAVRHLVLHQSGYSAYHEGLLYRRDLLAIRLIGVANLDDLDRRAISCARPLSRSRLTPHEALTRPRPGVRSSEQFLETRLPNLVRLKFKRPALRPTSPIVTASM